MFIYLNQESCNPCRIWLYIDLPDISAATAHSNWFVSFKLLSWRYILMMYQIEDQLAYVFAILKPNFGLSILLYYKVTTQIVENLAKKVLLLIIIILYTFNTVLYFPLCATIIMFLSCIIYNIF